MASNKKSKVSRHLTTRATRRQVIKAGGIAALGLAFSKPIIETLHPRPVSAQVSPIGLPRGTGGQSFEDILVVPQQFATIEEAKPLIVMVNDGIIKTGKDDDGKRLRVLIQFDVSSRNGADIDKAELFLFNLLHDTSPPGKIIPHTLHRITSPWIGPPPGTDTGDATWAANNAAFAVSVSDPSTDVDMDSETYSWDITDIVQLWVSGTPNYGVMLIGDETTMFQDSFMGDPGILPFPAAKLEIEGTTAGSEED